MDIGAVVLHLLLKDKENALEQWSKLKYAFFASEFTSVYSNISKYYDKYSTLPSFADLEITVRDKQLKTSLKALEKLDVPEDISLDLAVDALINEYTQNQTLEEIEDLIDNITLLDTEEIKLELNNISLRLEEKTHTSETLTLMSDIAILESEDELSDVVQVPLQFSNKYDAEIRCTTSELIMVGGARGSGKSIVCTNIFVNQYEQGNVCPYFSIEMNSREVFERTISVLSGVNHKSIRNKELNHNDLQKIAKVRADMFEESDVILDNYLSQHHNYKKFEHELRTCHLKKDNQLIIVDNQRLTLSDIDLNLQKFKGQFGDKMRVVIVDYVNQIEPPGKAEDIYDWKTQINLSKGLKNLARKHNVVMFTPYQIDNKGEARLAKGLLDAADMAMILEANKDPGYLKFTSTKTRGSEEFTIASGINWESLKIYPQEYVVEHEGDENTEEIVIPKAKTNKALPEQSNDIPWDN